MASTTTYTAAECLTKIAALEAALEEIVMLPTRGRTGKTMLDHSKTPQEIERQLQVWRGRLKAARNGGRALRKRRGC